MSEYRCWAFKGLWEDLSYRGHNSLMRGELPNRMSKEGLDSIGSCVLLVMASIENILSTIKNSILM